MTWERPRQKNSGSGWKLIREIYDTVHMAVCSLLIAFTISFCVFILPRMPQLQADIQAKRILEIAAENRSYCEKWGFAPGTQKHTACTLDLEKLRAKIDQRAFDEMFP